MYKGGVKDKMTEKKIGVITHYFDHINVGIIKLNGDLKIGDRIRIKGKISSFEQEVNEMQVDHKNISQAKKGQEIGIKVTEKVREGDEVISL